MKIPSMAALYIDVGNQFIKSMLKSPTIVNDKKSEKIKNTQGLIKNDTLNKLTWR